MNLKRVIDNLFRCHKQFVKDSSKNLSSLILNIRNTSFLRCNNLFEVLSFYVKYPVVQNAVVQLRHHYTYKFIRKVPRRFVPEPVCPQNSLSSGINCLGNKLVQGRTVSGTNFLGNCPGTNCYVFHTKVYFMSLVNEDTRIRFLTSTESMDS